MRVYLTGGSGLLGSHAAERLVRAGHEVVCLQRSQSDASFLGGLGCSIVEGDVRDGPRALTPGMRGCDAVVHAAALVYAGRIWPKVRAVNVEGTAHVVSAAARAGVDRMVHISSVAVYGGVDGPIDETSPTDLPVPPSDLYARSKREAEAAVTDGALEGRLGLTILRPSGAYGERDRLLAPRVAKLAKLPLIPLLGDGDNPLPLVYAGNVAAAVERALEREEREPRAYDVAMDHPLTQKQLVAGIARGLGRKPRFVSLPAGMVSASAELADALGLPLPAAGDLPMTRALRLSVGDNPFGSKRIRRELEWRPPFGNDEALARTAAWLLKEGWG